MHLLLILCAIVALLHLADAARILGVFHMATISHYRLGDKILKELAARGHEVTVITPFEEKTPIKNFKQILLTGIIEQVEEQKAKNLFKQPSLSLLTKIILLDVVGLFFTENILNHTNVQSLLKSKEQFDLIIMEHFLNQAFTGFCYHFNAPCVLSSTVGANRWTNQQMGNPGPLSYVPDLYLPLSSSMTFWERFDNTFAYILAQLFSHLYTLPKQNQILQKYFPNAPHLYELHYNTSLMLLNSHISINPPVPQVPGMIEIGGFHIGPLKSLSKDLQDYLDSAKDGAILFSMGSSLKSANLPIQKRNALLGAFSKLKQKVLMKWDEELPGQPPNVKLCKWLPQQDLLAHPNIKLFVHHGGLLSIIEGIYHGKPFVGIPIFGDHEMNVANGEMAGFGVGIPFQNLTEEVLNAALHELLTNPKYIENAEKRSKILHDESMTSLDKAIFWIEYVLRHQGAPHLKIDALKLRWYQYLLLDVLVLIALVALVVLYIFWKIIKKICRYVQYFK